MKKQTYAVDKIAPNSRFLLGLRANTLNNARRCDEAKALYEKLMERDPHRLDFGNKSC